MTTPVIAALVCGGLALWFGWLIWCDIVRNPLPADPPCDECDDGRLLAGAATCGGCGREAMGVW